MTISVLHISTSADLKFFCILITSEVEMCQQVFYFVFEKRHPKSIFTSNKESIGGTMELWTQNDQQNGSTSCVMPSQQWSYLRYNPTGISIQSSTQQLNTHLWLRGFRCSLEQANKWSVLFPNSFTICSYRYIYMCFKSQNRNLLIFCSACIMKLPSWKLRKR